MKKTFIIWGSIITFIIIITIVMIFGLYRSNQLSIKRAIQLRTAECQGVCDYIPATKVWNYNIMSDTGRTIAENSPEKYGATLVNSPTKYFQTQEQCLNYCLTQ